MHRVSGLAVSKRRFLVTWLVPVLAGFALFRVWPLVYGLFISFFKWDILSKARQFRGFGNYADNLHDSLFLTMLANTSYFAFATAVLGMIVAFLIALMLDHIRAFTSFFRTLFYLPGLTSIIAVSIVWLWLYQPQFGLFNGILRSLGLPALSWLDSTQTAMPSLIIMSVWGGIGFPVIVFLAGLQSIPKELYEAADVDGGSGLIVFGAITLPLMRPVILFIMVTSLMNGFLVFQQIYVMTKGGPLNSTTVFGYQIFQLGFSQFKFGAASSLAFILFALVLVLTVVQLRVGRTTNQY